MRNDREDISLSVTILLHFFDLVVKVAEAALRRIGLDNWGHGVFCRECQRGRAMVDREGMGSRD